MPDLRKRYVVATLRDAQIQAMSHILPCGLMNDMTLPEQEDRSLVIFERQDTTRVPQ